MTYISASRRDNEVIVWERTEKGRELRRFPAPYYFFVEDPHGEYTSIYGTALKKLEFNSRDDMQRATERYPFLYESDIPADVKVLSEHYYKAKTPNLRVSFFDIEVDYDPEVGFAGVDNPYAPINSVAFYNQWENRMILFCVPPSPEWTENSLLKAMNNIEPLPIDVAIDVFLCKNEKEILLAMLDEIEEADVISGWNCIPVDQSVWGKNIIKTIKDCPDKLYDSDLINVYPRSYKEKWDIKLANGAIVSSSEDHKFSVLTHSPEKYTDFRKHQLLTKDMTVKDISESKDAVFLEINLRKNDNIDNPLFTKEQLYFSGLIYTDGSLKDKNNIKSGFTIYQSDKEMLMELPLIETSLVGPYKRCYSRYVKWSVINEASKLIYDFNNKKKLNLELLSTLSYSQFMFFLSGMLDGDGCVHNNTITLCNYSNDIFIIYELCLWNGIFTTITNNNLRFIHYNFDDLNLRKIKRWKDFTPRLLSRESKQQAKLIKFKIHDDKCFVYVKEVKNTKEKIEMGDIKTSSGYFYTRGVKTHNCDFFDIPYFAKRIVKVLQNGNEDFKGGDFRRLDFPGAPPPKFKKVNKFGSDQSTLMLTGRYACDYLELFKKYEMAIRPSYALKAIADEVMPDLPKLEYTGSLADLYRRDFPWFCRYNIRDVEVLKGFEERLGYISLANEMYHLSGGMWKDVLGTIKLSEMAINNYCIHELNRRVPNKGRAEEGRIAGAYVLDPKVGRHKMVSSIDINSLYPSAILSLNISPEKLIGQFTKNEAVVEEIKNSTDTPLEFTFDNGLQVDYKHRGERVTQTAAEWKEILFESQHAVSGYGTVFKQDEQGIIPSILAIWYATRKEYQKKKKEAFAEMNALVSKYKKD